MSKNWKRCKALIQLVSQVNAAYPGRDTSSDGSVGDADHASRDSDHNPWVIDPADNVGVVTAQDIDEDLNETTHSIKGIVDAIVASRDIRVKYVIYEGQMCRSYPAHGLKAWEWGPYTGKNAHKHHAHISVKAEKEFWNDDSPWSIGSAAGAPAEKPADSNTSDESASKPADQPTEGQAQPPIRDLKIGDRGEDVAKLQAKLGVKIDKIFGPATRKAVIKFQAGRRLSTDGIVGANTRKALGL